MFCLFSWNGWKVLYLASSKSRTHYSIALKFPSRHSDIVTILERHYPRYRYDIADILSMKHMTMSICDINLTSKFWDRANQTLMLSWHGRDNGHSERNPPGSYTSSVSATTMPRLYYGNQKIKASGNFFSVAATKYLYFFSKQCYSVEKLFLILQARVSTERGVLKCHQIQFRCILSTP